MQRFDKLGKCIKRLALFYILFFIFIPRLILAEENNYFCIDINTALKQELIKINQIGEARAEQIIELRKEKLFSSIDDLSRVHGIGPARISDIKDQGLACIQGKIKIMSETIESKKNEQIKPEIIISYSQNSLINKEIKLTLFLKNFENNSYDLKISIEKDKNLSDIYNEKENKWQSSHYYINNFFSGSYLEKDFKLKIREENLNFQGEADILVRVRDSGKNNFLEYKNKIIFNEPEREIKNSQPLNKETQASQQKIAISLITAFFSGTTVLILKRKIK